MTAVATPFAASVRDPVVPAPARLMVSVVIAIVSAPAPLSLTKVSVVPIGYGTLLFAGIVHVRAVVSVGGVAEVVGDDCEGAGGDFLGVGGGDEDLGAGRSGEQAGGDHWLSPWLRAWATRSTSLR